MPEIPSDHWPLNPNNSGSSALDSEILSLFSRWVLNQTGILLDIARLVPGVSPLIAPPVVQ